MGNFNAIKQTQLSLELLTIDMRDILFLSQAPCDVYGHKNGLTTVVLGQYAPILPETFRDLYSQNIKSLFIHQEDWPLVLEQQRKELTQITRSLSMGNPQQNVLRQMGLLVSNLKTLYQRPSDDEQLQHVYQGAKNLASFVIGQNLDLNELYLGVIKQKHSFLLGQPILSSMLLLFYLKGLHAFPQKDLEGLFITSFLKDIGMSNVPEDILHHPDITVEDLKKIKRHPEFSANILEGRTPLTRSQIKIILEHHLVGGKDEMVPSTLIGIETLTVSIMDAICAMISDRPYREKVDLFQALNTAKACMSDDYPHEFRYLVLFFRSLFKKR